MEYNIIKLKEELNRINMLKNNDHVDYFEQTNEWQPYFKKVTIFKHIGRVMKEYGKHEIDCQIRTVKVGFVEAFGRKNLSKEVKK